MAVARPEAIQKETAETVLRRLIERNDPAEAAATFILAVMLERKRILKVKDQLRIEDRRVFVYEHGGTGDVFTIADPELRLDQLGDVQRDVARLLEHRDAAPAAETVSPEPEPASDARAVMAEIGTSESRVATETPAAG